MHRLSRYNQFHPWQNGYYLAYNARSGAVAMMKSEDYSVFQQLSGKLGNGTSTELTPREQELLKQLEYGMFAHADAMDEIERLKFDHRKWRYDESNLGLVVAPTMACNMACVYCFEENKKGRMSAQVIEALADFVRKRAPRAAAVDVSWYGGEPLLALDIIESITRSLLDMEKQFRFKYTASMITNGYLLAPQIVDKLVDLRVSSIQVTLDGPARLHNGKRPLRNGRPSFDTIVGNLAYASSKMGVGIRVNVDKSFTPEIITELLDELEQGGLRERVGLYFGLLEANTSACANISESCYGVADFSQIEVEYYALLQQRGFRIDKLPSPSGTFCMAQLVNSFLIDPDGDLFRCFNYIGDKGQSFGNVSDPLNYDHPNFTRLFRFDPFEDSTCLQCNILPLCMGACPARRADRSFKKELVCESWKYNLVPMLDIIAQSRQQALRRTEAPKETV